MRVLTRHQTKRDDVEFFSVEGDREMRYWVQHIKGDWRCTCPHFIFRCYTGDVCKHIDWVQQVVAGQEIAKEE